MCTSEPAKIIICVLYRSPSAPLTDFKACLDAVHEYTNGKEDLDTYFLGDFNFPSISLDPPMVGTPGPSTELLDNSHNFMNNHLYCQSLTNKEEKYPGSIHDKFSLPCYPRGRQNHKDVWSRPGGDIFALQSLSAKHQPPFFVWSCIFGDWTSTKPISLASVTESSPLTGIIFWTQMG